MRWLDWLPFGAVSEIAPEDLARRLATPEPPILIDVRTMLEYRHGHIEGAHHMPVHTLATALPSLSFAPQVTVVAICKTAHRSIPAVRLLRRQGWTALQLAGGMDRWRQCGLPVVRGDPT